MDTKLGMNYSSFVVTITLSDKRALGLTGSGYKYIVC